MSVFDKTIFACKKTLKDIFSIEAIIDGDKKIYGVFSSPSVVVAHEGVSVSTVSNNLIFEVEDKGEIKEGKKIRIDGVNYVIDQIFRDSYGMSKLILREDYGY